MNSNILNTIGLGNLDPAIIIIVLIVLILALLVLTILCMVKISKLTKKYNFFMRGRAVKSLESDIVDMFTENRAMREDIDRNTKNIEEIFETLKGVYQKMGLVKYDAFSQMGGKLSFCLALLDEEDNGFLINSVHGNDSSYSYIKRITQGQCKMELSAEEDVALKKAVGNNMTEDVN